MIGQCSEFRRNNEMQSHESPPVGLLRHLSSVVHNAIHSLRIPPVLFLIDRCNYAVKAYY
jgi:hypothetical protein